jgi:hypothetical protein
MTKLDRIDLLTLALELRLAARLGIPALAGEQTRLTPALLLDAAQALECASRLVPPPSGTVVPLPRLNCA